MILKAHLCQPHTLLQFLILPNRVALHLIFYVFQDTNLTITLTIVSSLRIYLILVNLLEYMKPLQISVYLTY